MGYKDRTFPLADNGLYSSLYYAARQCSCYKVREGVVVQNRAVHKQTITGAVLLSFTFQMATIYIPFLNPVFKTQPLDLDELVISLGLASIIFFAVEIEKWWKRRQKKLIMLLIFEDLKNYLRSLVIFLSCWLVQHPSSKKHSCHSESLR